MPEPAGARAKNLHRWTLFPRRPATSCKQITQQLHNVRYKPHITRRKSSQVTRYLLRLMPQAMNAFAAGDEWRTAPLLNMLLLLLLLLLPPPLPPEASAESSSFSSLSSSHHNAHKA
jgi:hypothetical protein